MAKAVNAQTIDIVLRNSNIGALRHFYGVCHGCVRFVTPIQGSGQLCRQRHKFLINAAGFGRALSRRFACGLDHGFGGNAEMLV